MNTKNTWIWLVVAAGLFAGIYVFDHYLRPAPVVVRGILPQLHSAAVTGVQVIPAGAFEIRADRRDGTWVLSKPVAYPAQSAAIEALLNALEKLMPATRISAAELRGNKSAEADFGFDVPQVALVIQMGAEHYQVVVGHRTAPGDQVFLRVVGMDGAFVTDADWLKFIPRTANDWRNTALVESPAIACDWIVLTNAAKVIELRRDATNHLWHMLRPFPARADAGRIAEALQQLQAGRVTQFVTDDARADLAKFGLQPAEMDLWLGRGTNVTAAVHEGKNPPNEPAQVYARREGWNAVVTTPKTSLAPWHGSVNDFRDSHLLELTAPPAEIEVGGPDNTHFTLQRQGSNDWRLAGEKFPVDAENVQGFVQLLAGLRVAEFVSDVVTAPDLPAYGLANPSRQITLRPQTGGSGAVIAQLFFGTNQADKVFVRRADEESVYAVALAEFSRLPENGWEFRGRRVWNFNERDVAQITLHQNGRTRQIIHDAANKWSLAAGSQGIIVGPALEETAHRFGELTATGWVARGLPEPEKLGFKASNLSATFELKDGEKLTVDFGAELPTQTALAAVTLDGERWVFVFPATLYQFVLTYFNLPVPPGGAS
jgi:hypothetical protein